MIGPFPISHEDVQEAFQEGFCKGFRTGLEAASRWLRTHSEKLARLERARLPPGATLNTISGQRLYLEMHGRLIDAHPRDEDYTLEHEDLTGFSRDSELWDAQEAAAIGIKPPEAA